MPLSFFDDTVIVSRAPVVTVNLRSERDWSDVANHAIAGCSVQPSSSSTDGTDPGRPASIAYTLIAPPGADLLEGDRIDWGGSTFVIDGAPLVSTSPTGRVSHVRARLVAWEG